MALLKNSGKNYARKLSSKNKIAMENLKILKVKLIKDERIEAKMKKLCLKLNEIKKMDCYVKLRKIDAISQVIFQCSECIGSFVSEKSLQLHWEKAHKNTYDRAKNKENKYSFNFRVNNMEKESKKHSSEQSDVFINQFRSKSSSSCSLKDKSLTKTLCNRMYNNHNQEIRNKERICLREIFTCSRCDSKFESESQFENHYETVHSSCKGNVIECSHCSDVCSSKEDLFWHLHTFHFQLRTYRCSDCGVISTNIDELDKHRDELHKKKVNTHACWVCSSILFSEDELISHFDNEHFRIP